MRVMHSANTVNRLRRDAANEDAHAMSLRSSRCDTSRLYSSNMRGMLTCHPCGCAAKESFVLRVVVDEAE